MVKSLRKQVFECLDDNPKIRLKNLKKKFSDYNEDTVQRYLTQHRHKKKRKKELTPGEVLKEIFLDRRQPGSTRVQAIREYNNTIKDSPEAIKEQGDPLLKLLLELEDEDQK